jgi:hypothetical protein
VPIGVVIAMIMGSDQGLVRRVVGVVASISEDTARPRMCPLYIVRWCNRPAGRGASRSLATVELNARFARGLLA